MQILATVVLYVGAVTGRMQNELERVEAKLSALRDRVLVLEQWRIYIDDARSERSTSIPTWVAISVTAALGIIGLLYQMFVTRPGA